MQNLKIVQFSFFQPVVIKNKALSDGKISNFLWQIGCWADQFAYLGDKQLNVIPEKLNIRKYSFEKKFKSYIPMTRTAGKVILYIGTFFMLPLIALAIKVIYKWQLNSVSMLKENNVNTYIAGKQIGQTKLVLFKGNLLIERTDAIVNAANAQLAAGSGLCGAFKNAAGDEIFKECEQILNKQKITHIQTGEAVLTTIGDLKKFKDSKVKAIVHAVGPNYGDKKNLDDQQMAALLAKTYTSSLELIINPAANQKMVSDKLTPQPLRSIGFPSISTGIYQFPLELAAKTAFEAIKAFVDKHPKSLDEVRFVFLMTDDNTIKAYTDALNKL